MKAIALSVAAVLGLGAAAYFVLGARGEASGILPYEDATAVARGQATYETYCAACHGAGLQGQPNWRERDADGYLPAPPHDETGHTWHHPDMQLFLITKHGTAALVGDGYRSNMAGFGAALSDEDILEVLAYIKSTWPAQVIRRHNEINESVARQ